MKKYVDPSGRSWKMSNSFKIVESEEEGVTFVEATGSPSDIRKMRKIAAAYGYIPYHSFYPIMREGRKYGIRFIEYDQFFYHFKVNGAV